MSDTQRLIDELYAAAGQQCVTAPDVAHVEIHGNEILGVHAVEGLAVDARPEGDVLDVTMRIADNAWIVQPIRVCFGMLGQQGRQEINMHVVVGSNARAAVLAACTFPNARGIEHVMKADITIRRGAHYAYYERHVHGGEGGVEVVPRTEVVLEEEASFQTDFEVIRGRAGKIDLEYDARCMKNSVLTMTARISGRDDDAIKVHEKAHLEGEYARGALTTNVAVIGRAQADIRNTLIASAPYARGHVDCKEIIRDRAVARAVPIVEVRDPRAHVTHEAALGSVDSKQLQTLMARGLSEEAATELIIEGMLQPAG